MGILNSLMFRFSGRALTRRWPGLIALSGLLVIGLVLFGFWGAGARRSQPPLTPAAGSHDGLSLLEAAQLRPGDIVLRRGKSLASELIVSALNDGSGLSHCALVLAAPNGAAGGRVLHSVSGSFGLADGVQEQSLADFNANNASKSLVVVRPRLAGRQRAALLAATGHYRGYPFDNAFGLGERRALYCSELLVTLFEAAAWWPSGLGDQSPFYKMSGKFLNFQTFLDPRYFELIISHNPAVSGVWGGQAAILP